jgi:hypothetical protein
MAAIIVGGAHVVVLWLIQKIHYARDTGVEEFGSIYLYSPVATVSRRARRAHKPVSSPRSRRDLSPESSEVSSAPLSGVEPLALPSAPPAPAAVDWQQALESVATDVIERAKRDAARAALMGKPQPSPSFQPLHERPHDFAWVSEHSRLVISAQGVPQWVLVQPCAVVILRNDPDCTAEHIERHGVLFEYMQEQHEATLGYGGPTAIP